MHQSSTRECACIVIALTVCPHMLTIYAAGDFFFDHDPDTTGLFVASGGSGHGFKFSPIIGKLIADIFERKPHKFAHRFAWRFPKGKRHYDILRHTNVERARL